MSVLFCDLVGYTTMSESRDPEEVRELLSGYFDLARSIVARYGGVVEKFIGDAVMAVWGAPVANEDDAERAVRAGLELVSAVGSYGRERGVELESRVGIVTGGAATRGTAEVGLVIGDRVNTAARIQSVAPPGCCYVDETTRIATAAAIAYTDAGVHELKGKSERPHLYQATRVVAAVGGSQRANVLEAPFTGRDHELNLVKALFHASAERGSARLVLVSGVAGVGKSRLAWEFFKYIDGLAGTVLWHAGRCLSYGEGVSYWALSEMVRSRLQIGEEDPQDVTADRIASGLERWIPDASDRAFISPRIHQLLGLPTAQSLPREDLFSGWRLFFERLAEHEPVVMVIEDLQWADAGMLEFLDHLLEWSGDHAIFLLVLTRPEGTERSGLGLSHRSVTALPLDPLTDELIGQLIDGFVADLPAGPRTSIVERAEGIPLYAVETVRSLVDKGALSKDADGVLHLVGKIGTLEIPPGLTALIASRLDALSPGERRVVKECSVLGSSFPRPAVEAVTDADPTELDDILSALVRREIFMVRADKLSPERGQYAFTQELIRSVAYDMLSRAERKARHLRTAAHLRAAFPDEGAEVAEVIASHLHDAYKASADDPDADDLRSEARHAYVTAAERAASVGAPDAAETAYLRAADLSADEAEQADAMELAGRMAQLAQAHERALSHLEAAVSTHKEAGRVVEAARVTAALAFSVDQLGRNEQTILLTREALASLPNESAHPDVRAELVVRLATALLFAGHTNDAIEPTEEALRLSQLYKLPEVLSAALNIRSIVVGNLGRYEEARFFLEASLSVAAENGLTRRQMVAEGNLADLCMTLDQPGAEEHCQAAIALSRRLSSRIGELVTYNNWIYVLTMQGRFEDAYNGALGVLPTDEHTTGTNSVYMRLATLDAVLGRIEAARSDLEKCRDDRDSDDVQIRANYYQGDVLVSIAEGRFDHAFDVATRTLSEVLGGSLAFTHEAVRMLIPYAIDSGLATARLDELAELLDQVSSRPPGETAPFQSAQLRRGHALLRSAKGDDEGVEQDLVQVELELRAMGYPYWAACAELDLAEWLSDRGRTDEAATTAEAAAATFEQLGAQPALARARAVSVRHPTTA